MPAPRHIALVADTHGHLDDRVSAVARSCALVIHAGDVGCASVLDELGGNGARVVAVAGNNDTPSHWPDSDHATLATLPPQATLDVAGGRLVVVHGHEWPARVRHARLRARHEQAGAIVLGHSHRRAIDRDDVPWILNPGAAGRSRAYGGPGCLVLTTVGGDWRITEHAFERRRKRR